MKNSLYISHKYFGKYFNFLVSGNTIAVRLEQGKITEATAQMLFMELEEKLKQ